jgi:hypothetical protein
VNYLLVFVVMASLAWLWVWYFKAVAAGRHAFAALMDGGLVALSGLVTITYVGHPGTLAAAVVGGIVGTYTASRWGGKK